MAKKRVVYELEVAAMGMPGSVGQALKQRSRWGWIAGLGAVGFLFYHTLINPRGELAQAMADASICGLGQAAPNPVRSVFRYFPEDLR